MSKNIQEWIGNIHTQKDVITTDKLARYRAVFGGPESVENGAMESADVPRGFHFMLCTPDTPMAELAADGHPQKGGFLPPITLPRRMWVESAIDFYAPLKMGAAIKRGSRIASITEKIGKQGKLIFVEIDHAYWQNEAVAIFETQKLVYREAAKQPLPLPPVSDDVQPRKSIPSRYDEAEGVHWEGDEGSICFEKIIPDEVLLFRYSALTFNTHRIHYDAAYAKNIEHYPALVVHGPLMASLVLHRAQQQFGTISQFTFRAQSPAYCGQPLYIDFTQEGDKRGFLVRGGDGRTIMNGWLN